MRHQAGDQAGDLGAQREDDEDRRPNRQHPQDVHGVRVAATAADADVRELVRHGDVFVGQRRQWRRSRGGGSLAPQLTGRLAPAVGLRPARLLLRRPVSDYHSAVAVVGHGQELVGVGGGWHGEAEPAQEGLDEPHAGGAERPEGRRGADVGGQRARRRGPTTDQGSGPRYIISAVTHDILTRTCCLI